MSKEETLRDRVRQKYAGIATGMTNGCCGSASCCTATVSADELVAGMGYDAADVHTLPDGINMGLSCGNPVAVASLKAGETVLDIGCGGGFDVFQAGPRVGATGRIIGVDMTEEMLTKARNAQSWYHKHTGLDNVEFRHGTMEALPVDDGTVDVILSNCVINLSCDKAQAWREIFRVLRQGGRVAISDIALLRPLPPVIAQSVEALVGCVAGAMLLEETRAILTQCGFSQIETRVKPGYVASLRETPLYREIEAALPEGATLPEFIASVEIVAAKP